MFRLGQRAAQSDIPILIEGESGAGKELIARAIQGTSARAGKPFVTVNCGAIPENLIESILFGHEKGSFTGATDKHLGKFQEADGGTLFLDEIGELRLDMQVKLLRALQEGEVDPVGSKRPGEGRCAHHLGHQSRSGPDGARGQLPRRSVLSPQRLSHHGAVAARPPRRHRAAGPPLHRPLRGRGEQAGRRPDAAGGRSCSSASPGPAMCASWRTPSSAPSSCATARMLDVCDFPQIAAAMGVEPWCACARCGRRPPRHPAPAAPALPQARLTRLSVDRRRRPYPQVRGAGIRNHPHGDRPL